MFYRGQLGPCEKWMAELDVKDEMAAIERNWIKTGKMIAWNMLGSSLRVIGPKFMGAGEADNLCLQLYTFPDLERFKEWALGAPEHIALHTKVVNGLKATGRPPLPAYAFHATDDPNADIAAIRAELRAMYQAIEKMPWAGVPPGTVQLMMLGDHD